MRRMSHRDFAIFIFSQLILFIASSAAGQASVPSADGFTFDANFRYRTELVDWYRPSGPDLNSEYAFHQAKLQLGTKYQVGGFRAYVQGQYFQLVDLPFNGAGPGFVYSSTNDNSRNPGDFVLRQFNLTYGDTVEKAHYEFAVGRMFYANGSEAPAEDKALEALKKQRIYNRVLGTFDYTAGRSFDALRAKYEFVDIATLAGGFMRPTQGGFATDGSIEIQDIDLGTVAWSISPALLPEKTDAQLFWYYYGDDRQNTVKTDNRPLDVRKADTEDIQLHNVGAQWVELFPGEALSGQLVLWGVLQAGDWGPQDVLAGAFAAEGGLQFPQAWAKPLLLVGFNYGSGDNDPSDDKHRTFMQMLPTARQYAYMTFYNMMNNQDLFIATSLKPTDKLSLLGTLHYLQLADSHDLLYSGGGANLNRGQFGFAGTKLSGSTLGFAPELSISYDVIANLNISLFYGHLFPSESFDTGTESSSIDYAFAEANVKY